MPRKNDSPVQRLSGAPVGRLDTLFEGSAVTLSAYVATLPFVESLSVTFSSSALLVCNQGFLAFSTPQIRGRLSFLYPGAVAFVPAKTQVNGIGSAGEHHWDLVTWRLGVLPLVDAITSTSNPGSVVSTCSSLLPTGSLRPFEAPQEGPLEFDLLASVLQVVPRLLSQPGWIAIAPCPGDLPEPVGPLVQRVRADPTQRWSLGEAAEAAGYSPFHFSRTFKQYVGCGFHEFVDRCRTELALQWLSEGCRSPSEVWPKAGFPSARAMRESIKDYLGLSTADLVRLRDNSMGTLVQSAAERAKTS